MHVQNPSYGLDVALILCGGAFITIQGCGEA
jgi:hypothetical protein